MLYVALLLWETQDAMIPASNAADYLQAIPGSRLVRLEGQGQLPQEGAAQGFLPPLRELLDASMPP